MLIAELHYILEKSIIYLTYFLQFRKIYKMKCDGDTEWTEKLQPAVIAANTQTKKSTSYTPFYLMFGRNFDSSNLLNLITSPNDPGINSQMLTELESSDEELPECVDDPYDLPKNDDEWIDTISSTRKNDKMTAIQNIKKNQKVQKKTYDSKVKHNR